MPTARRARVIEILAVLGFPLAGAALLAVIGERRQAAAVNIAFSFLTFAAAVALTVRVIVSGPLLVARPPVLRRLRSTCSSWR